jgi:type IV secretory pathway VirJ component
MSRASLLEFCNKLHKSLSTKGGTQIYRDLVANKRVHIFKFNWQEMAKQMKAELENKATEENQHFDKLTQKDRQKINQFAKEMLADLKRDLRKIRISNSKMKATKNTVRFTFTSGLFSRKVITFKSGKSLSPDNVYAKVRIAYQPSLRKFFNKVQAYLRTTTTTSKKTGRIVNRSIRTKSGRSMKGTRTIFHSGHEKGAGVFESFVRDAFEGIADGVGLDFDGTVQDLSDEKGLGVTSLIKVLRNDKDDSHTVGVESAYLNKLAKETGSGVDVSRLKEKLKSELLVAIKKLEKDPAVGDGLSKLQGSDSIFAKKQKKLRKLVVDAFRDNPNVSVVTTESLKSTAKSSNNKKKSTSSVAKGASTVAFGKGVKAKRVRTPVNRRPSVASDMLRMITMINKELPDTVRKNMNAPALENRTGRFAESVKVTEVAQTPKGFPSVGYTYQKNPYQVYEMGRGSQPWATPERDPRKIIDASIREIAARMAIGRFFTRRV